MSSLTHSRAGEELDKERLLPLLVDIIKNKIDNLDILQFSGGYSNLTYLLTINNHHQLVLRRPPLGAKIKAGHDMAREYNILKALFPNHIKVPKPIYFCDDNDILGADFYIMEYVDGWILRSDIKPENHPNPARMRSIFEVFTDQFVALHQVNFTALGLGDISTAANYPERQISGWTKRYQNAKTDEVTSVDKLILWLQGNVPLSSGAALIHNDFKYDNLILDRNTDDIRAILDWEMSTIGDPLMDLGSSLAYWINDDDPPWIQAIKLSPTTIPGNPSREGLLQAYALKSGSDPGDGVFYYAYGMIKLAVIAQQIYARYKSGHTTNPKFAGLNKVVDACAIMALQAIHHKKIDHLF
jgi:aminoglycoside phosphotransferase (APT) family kinase protein